MARGRTHALTFTGLLSRLNRKPLSAPAVRQRSDPRKRLRWIPGELPTTEEEQILHEALTQEGLETLEEATAHLAYTLYWRDFLRGGWATDIGLLRSLYAREAQDIIGRLLGVRLRIEEGS